MYQDNEGSSSGMHSQFLRRQKSLASGIQSASARDWTPEASQSNLTQSTPSKNKSPKPAKSTALNRVRQQARRMMTYPSITPLPSTPAISHKKQGANQHIFVTSPKTITSFGCRDAMRGPNGKFEDIPPLSPLPALTLDCEPELVVRLWLDELRKMNAAAILEAFLTPQDRGFTFWEAERYKKTVQAMHQSLLAASSEEREDCEGLQQLLDYVEESQTELYDALQAEDPPQVHEALEVSLKIMEKLAETIVTAKTVSAPANKEPFHQDEDGSSGLILHLGSTDSLASSAAEGLEYDTPEETPSELFSPTSFFFVEGHDASAGDRFTSPTPYQRKIRRARSSAAVLTSIPLAESSRSDVSTHGARTDSSTKFKAFFWKRGSSSSVKSKSSVDSTSTQESECASRNISATELDTLTRALHAAKDIRPLELDHLPSPKIAKMSSRADVKWDTTGRVTEMSARAILHKLCVEYRHPPKDDEFEVLLTDTIFAILHIIWRPADFATMLRDFYGTATDRSAVIGLAEKWIREHWTPLDRDEETRVITTLTCFLGENMDDEALEDGFGRILALLHRLKAYDTHRREYARPHSLPEISEGSLPFSVLDMTRNVSMIYRDCKNISLREFFDERSMEVFGGQLTLRQWALVHAISASEFVDFCIKPGVDRGVEEKIARAKSFEDMLGRWVWMSVLKRSTPAKRAEVVDFFVRLARFLTSLHNFPGAFVIYDVLTGSEGIDFDKLPLTKAAIADSTWEGIQYLHNWLPKNSYVMSSQALGKPIIPILGCCAEKLRNLTMDKNMAFKSDIDDSTVVYNLEYLGMLKAVVEAIADGKKHLYGFPLMKHFQEYLDIEFSHVPSSDETIAHFNVLKTAEKESFGDDRPPPIFTYF